MKARMIVNPRAGAGRAKARIQQAADILREAGWQLDVVMAQSGGHGSDLARKAAEDGYYVVIACGGDGTINDVLQGLVGTDTALAVIPKGTVNAFAREFGVPREPVAAARALLTSQVRVLDVGQVNDRYFLLWAGVGFDAEIVRTVESGRRRRLWVLPFVAAAVRAVVSFEGANAAINFDGQLLQRTTLLALVANVRRYALFTISDAAQPDDGLLELYVFGGKGIGAKLRHLVNFLLGQRSHGRGLQHWSLKEASIESVKPLPVQVDGEFAGVTPITCRVIPRSLKVLLPVETYVE